MAESPNPIDQALGGAQNPIDASLGSPVASSSNPIDEALSGNSRPQNGRNAVPEAGSSTVSSPLAYEDSTQPWYKRAFEWANTPLTESLFGLPEYRKGAGGFERTAESLVSGFTAPLSLGLTAATFGTGGFLESAGATALREAGLSADEIAQAVKGSEAALQASKDLKPVEPVVQQALEAGGHDVDLFNRAKEAVGPLNLETQFGDPAVQEALAKKGFSPDEISELGKASETAAQARQGFTPVEDAVKAAGVDPSVWRNAQDILYKNGLTEQDLLGGNLVERGAFHILRKTIPDAPISTVVKSAKTANLLLQGGFTYQQLESAASLSPRFLDALKEGDYDHAKEYGTEALIGGTLGLLGASHALHSAGETFRPITETPLKPSDQALALQKAMGERDAVHSTAEEQAIKLDNAIRRKTLEQPEARPVLGDSAEVKAKKQLELASVLHQVVTGGDKDKAAAWFNSLSDVAKKDERLPVNGQPVQDQVVSSPEFKKWFGNSEVVDSQGKPKVLYHGTKAAGFQDFSKDNLSPWSLYGPGVYMTEDPDVASDYAGVPPDKSTSPIAAAILSSKFLGIIPLKDIRDYFTPGKVVKSYGGYDKVIKFNEPDPNAPYPYNRWSVNVIETDKNGTPKPGAVVRNHSTPPDADNFVADKGKAVYPLRAAIEKPFDIDAQIPKGEAEKIFGKFNQTKWIDDLYGDKPTVSGNALYHRASLAYDLEGDSDAERTVERERKLPPGDSAKESVNTLLQEAGYDGIKHTGGRVTGGKPHQVWIAFDPKQVKSAFDPAGAKINRSGLVPENLPDLVARQKFTQTPKEYQDLVLNSLSRVAKGELSDKEVAAAKQIRSELDRNFEIGDANDILHHYIEDYMTRAYKDTNPEGKVITSEAKQGRFATKVSQARNRVFDSHLTALLLSPKVMDMDPVGLVAQGRADTIKAAANKQLIDTLRDNFVRGSDGRPSVVLSGAGNLVTGPDGQDPRMYINPNRVRKITIADPVIDHLKKTGDFDRFLADGTIRDVTPRVNRGNLSAAIDRLEEAVQKREPQYATAPEGGPRPENGLAFPSNPEPGEPYNVLRQQLSLLKDIQAEKRPITDLDQYNSQLQSKYAWDPQDYVQIAHGALKGWNFVTNSGDGTPVFVRSDIRVHPEFAEYIKNRLGLEESALRKNAVSKALLGAGTKLKETLLSLSPFHLVQEGLRGIMVGVNPFAVTGPDIESGERVNPEDPNSPTIIRKAVEHGFTPGTDYKSLQEHSEGLSSGGGLLRKIPGVGKTLANSMNWYQDFLFKRYLPALKARSVELMFREYQRLHPDWSVDRAAKAAAIHTNDLYGGQNYRALGRSTTTQDWGRLLMLAPDWLESEMRAGARLFNKDEGDLGRAQVAKMAMGLWGVARVLNLLTTRNPHFEAPFGLATRNKEGKETIFSIRTLPTDLLHAASDPVGFLKGRLSPTVNAGVELVSQRDRYGRKLAPEDLWADVFRNMAPIPVQTIGQTLAGTGPEVGTPAQLYKSVGGTARTYYTPAEEMAANLAANHTEDGPVDPAQLARHRTLMHIEDRVRSGEIPMPDLYKMYAAGQLNQSDLKKITDNVRETHGMPPELAALYSRASRLPAPDYLKLLDQMNPSEKTALLPLTLKVRKRYLTKAMKDERPEERMKDPVFLRYFNMAPQEAF